MTQTHGRAGALLALTAGQLVLALGLGGIPAHAATSEHHGWWSRTALAPGVGVTPPDVPDGGLYVSGTSTNPLAFSAVAFDVTPAPQHANLTLHITGTPVITAPPVVCGLTHPFTPAQGGAWADAPTFDCAPTATGRVDANQTAVQFDLTAYIRSSGINIAVFAGAASDRIAFTAPDFADLATTASPATGPTSSVVQASPPSQPQPAPDQTGPDTAVAPPLQALSPAPAPAPNLAPTSPPPAVLNQQPPQAGGLIPAATTRTSHPWTIGVGVTLVLACLCYWADGFGAWPVRRHRALADSAATPSDRMKRMVELMTAEALQHE